MEGGYVGAQWGRVGDAGSEDASMRADAAEGVGCSASVAANDFGAEWFGAKAECPL